MLELRNICKSFGDVRVLDGVNLCLEHKLLQEVCSLGNRRSRERNCTSGGARPANPCVSQRDWLENVSGKWRIENGKRLSYRS
jgi:hypothetical protein